MLVAMNGFVFGFEGVSGDGHYEPAMLDALQTDEPVGKALDSVRRPVNNEGFEAGIVIEVRVAG